jgi:hypothetical protein
MVNQWTNKNTARIAGLLYLLFIVASIFADSFGKIGFGNAETIINRMSSHEFLFRIGFIFALLSAFLFLLTAWVLYVLLQPVNRNGALLFLVLNVCGVAIHGISLLNLIAGMNVLPGNQAQAVIYIVLYKNGFNIAQLFYGAWVFPLGYLIYQSKFIPKILGIFLMVDCFAILTYFLQFFLFPDYKTIAYICYAISAVSEFSLTFWLLIKGRKNENK